MLDIIGKRYIYFGVSLLLIVPGMIILAIWGLPLAIDFVGGTLLEAQFESGSAPAPASVIELYNGLGITDAQVTTTGEDILIIRSSALDNETRVLVLDTMEETFNDTVIVRRFDTVGPTIGQEVTTRGAIAVAVSAIGVILFIIFAFRGVPHAFRYGICAILAMLHDVLIMLSLAAIGGKFFGWQIDSLFLTALLTVIGFSTQDSIVVFDRIRENSNIHRRLTFEKLTNHSVVQSLQRSINTQLMTSEFLLLALALLGGVTLREFALVLLVGLASGTYSSIFIAAPVLVVWENREWKNWFKPRKASLAS
jgi:preprotein translocase subunit SecF